MEGLFQTEHRPIEELLRECHACRRCHDKHIEEKAGKPVDRDEWYMTPQTVNAYYNPTTNEICFPAGILQYPFFDPKADDAFNYGAIGVVIGHEMTHGFDDQGRQYDADGNMNDWWTASRCQGLQRACRDVRRLLLGHQGAPRPQRQRQTHPG